MGFLSELLAAVVVAVAVSVGVSLQATSYLGGGVKLDLQQLLPANQSYISYAGSLTTPPCTEGVLWVIMLNAQKMSLQQVRIGWCGAGAGGAYIGVGGTWGHML